MSTLPRVSICMPNLNNLRYLPERMTSIVNQSLSDWELIVVDGCSGDGAWDYLVGEADRDPRIHLYQASPEGIYAALNRCITHARGDFIYIAPGDDVMALDCLEQLVKALDSHPACDLAHCRLQVLGEEAETLQQWWLQQSIFAQSTRSLLDKAHIRRAPLDGLLYLTGETVYKSLTQLLIRRTLFERIGLFDSRWGSIGDFHWGMRASLVANTIHVPDTWAGWRMHFEQATRSARIGSYSHWQETEEMISDALKLAWDDIPGPVKRGLQGGWRHYFHQRRQLQFDLQHRSTRIARFLFLLQQLSKGSGAAWDYLANRSAPRMFTSADIVKQWLDSMSGPNGYLVPVELR